MKLTGRQRDILSRFLDLYREARHPLHYSTVAEKLGISPMTAYDMLRLLEERGLIASKYVLSQESRSGRSTIVFSPTEKADDLMTQLAGESWDQEGWEEVKKRILQALREGKATDYRNLLDEILLRLPGRHSPMLYVAEMVTAILLYLHELRVEASTFQNLRSLGLPGEAWLNALAGLTIGLSLVERANRRITSLLLTYSRKYQEHLAKLSAESKDRLSEFTQEVIRILET